MAATTTTLPANSVKAEGRTYFRFALCQWYALARARGLPIARARKPGERTWVKEICGIVRVQDVRTDAAFKGLVALVALHGLRVPELTVEWLHRYFNTASHRTKHRIAAAAAAAAAAAVAARAPHAPRTPRPSTYDFMSTVLGLAGVATPAITPDDLRRVLPNMNERGLNGYNLTPEGRTLLRIDAWPSLELHPSLALDSSLALTLAQPESRKRRRDDD